MPTFRLPRVTIAFITIALAVAWVFAGASAGMMLRRVSFDGPVLLLWIAAMWGIGRPMVEWFVPMQSGHSLRTSCAFALGVGIVSTVGLIAGLAGFLSESLAWGIVLVGLVPALMFGLRAIKKTSTTSSDVSRWWMLALAPVAGMVLVAAFVPPGCLWGPLEPNGFDVISYHFQVPREWFDAGKIIPLQHNVFSYFPFAVEMHYLLAMYLGGGAYGGMYIAQLMHAAMIGMTLVAVHGVARLLKGDGWIASLIAGAAPWLWLLAPIGFNEGGLLLFGTLAIGLLFCSGRCPQRLSSASTENEEAAGDSRRYNNAPEPAEDDSTELVEVSRCHRNTWRTTVLAGAFAGLACGCKLTAVPLIVIFPAIAHFIVALREDDRAVKRALSQLGVYCLVALLVFSPWLIRNLVWTGNPIFPEGTSIFGKAHFSDAQVIRWNLAHSAPPEKSHFPLKLRESIDQIFLDFRFGYALIPLAILAFILRRDCIQRMLGISLLLMLLFWLTMTHLQGRFFVMSIPLLAILASSLPWRRTILGICCGMILIGLVRWEITYNRPDAQGMNLSRAATLGVLGIGKLDALKPFDLAQLSEDRTLILVGDTAPFWYSSLPMSRLRYCTVFDVDAQDKGAVDGWLSRFAPLPEGASILIDPNELLRFSRTYHAVPRPDDGILQHDGPYMLE